MTAFRQNWFQVDALRPRIRFFVVHCADGQRRLVMLGHDLLSSTEREALGRLGFHSVGEEGFLIRDRIRIGLAELREVFPNTSVIVVDPASITTLGKIRREAGAEERRQAIDLNNLLGQAHEVGVNAQGERVFEGAFGRWVETPMGDRRARLLEPSAAADRGRWLRVEPSSGTALSAAADGWVAEMISGRTMDWGDLKSFASLVTGIPVAEVVRSPRMRDVQEAVEAAMVRALARRVPAVDAGASFETGYELALQLHDRQPAFRSRTSDSIALQQYSTPLPLSIAVQHLVGDVAGKAVLEPTIGNGSLVSGLSGATVLGVELDPDRVARIRSGFNHAVIVKGDATTQDFRALNEGAPIDVVIANPPFGAIPGHRFVDHAGMRVHRIDHLIMLRALAARADDGIAAFIIGGDSTMERSAGEIRGGSKAVLSWIAERYQMQVVEVDGGLYAKQGAGFPVRIVLVGRKGGRSVVPERLDVLQDHSELRNWVTAARFCVDVEQAESDALLDIDELDLGTPQVGASSTSPQLPASAESAAGGELDTEVASAGTIDEIVLSAAAVDILSDGTVAPPDDIVFAAKEQRAAASMPARDANAAIAVENSYQSPYQAQSRIGDATSMIPRNLSTPTRLALEALESRRGPVDEFVANRMGWSVDLMREKEYLSPEQVDALALHIDASERGRAAVEGDMTGLGKGRVMASLARYAALQGRPTVFLTETATLFTDFWRDIRDLESEALFHPMILNAGTPVFDPSDGKILVPATSRTLVNQALADESIPQGINLVLATYSQFNRDPSKSPKAGWLYRAMGRSAGGVTLLLDEAHNAAGDSNTSRNVAAAIQAAQDVGYSSATSMKGASNVLIYSKLFPPSVDVGGLPATLKAGGEVLQEVLSGMMARDGVFIRREHDLSRLRFTTVTDEARFARNEVIADQLASILELMNYVAGDIQKIVSDENMKYDEFLKAIPEADRAGARMQAVQPAFGSRLFNIYRQFLMACMTDLTADQAIEALRENKKPVIVLENTMEAVLRDTVSGILGSGGDYDVEDDLSPTAAVAAMTGSSSVLLGANITFRTVLHRMADRLLYFKVRRGFSEYELKEVESKEAKQAVMNIKAMIDELPDLPASPLDVLRSRIEAAGYVVDELSGRKLALETGTEGEVRAVLREEKPKARIVQEFNAGESDALLLTLAGSTGISLHASERFQDQRQRVMIELQAASDVNKRVQFFGRVNRKGQVSSPEIRTLSTGLIGQARPIAMQNAKLRRLSANTTANQDTAALDRDVPDLINGVGNRVAYTYLEANPEIAKRLDIELGEQQEELGGDADTTLINRLLGRCVMLRNVEQKLLYDEITSEYLRTIAELDEKGLNPLRSREFDVRAREISREVFEPGDPLSDSVFDHPVYVKTIAYEEVLKPLRWNDVEAMQRIALERFNHLYGMVPSKVAQRFAGDVRRILPGLLEVVRGQRKEPVEELVAATEPNPVQRAYQRLQALTRALGFLDVGGVVRVSRGGDADDTTLGVIVDMGFPAKPNTAHRLGDYSVTLVIPGEPQRVVKSLATLVTDESFAVVSGPAFARDLENVRHAINAAPEGQVTRERLILDGNLFRAAAIASASKLGASAVYTDEEGRRLRGIMLRPTVSRAELSVLPFAIGNPMLAARIMVEHHDVKFCSEPSADPKLRAQGMEVVRNGNRLVVSVPGTKNHGARFFEDQRLLDITGKFSGDRALMYAEVGIQNAEALFTTLKRMGVSLYGPSNLREVVAGMHVADDVIDDGLAVGAR